MFSVDAFCFGQILCLVCAISVTAVVQNLIVMITLTGKLKFSLMCNKHSTTPLHWQNKGLGSILSQHVCSSHTESTRHAEMPFICHLFSPKKEAKIQQLSVTVMPTISSEHPYCHCAVSKKLHHRSHSLGLVYVQHLDVTPDDTEQTYFKQYFKVRNLRTKSSKLTFCKQVRSESL